MPNVSRKCSKKDNQEVPHLRVKSEGKLNVTYCKEVQSSKTDYVCDK